MTDFSLEFNGYASAPVRGLFVSAATSMLAFGVKNIVAAFWKPNTMAVLKSRVANVKIGDDTFYILHEAHAQLAFSGTKVKSLTNDRARHSVLEHFLVAVPTEEVLGSRHAFAVTRNETA